MNIIKRIFGKTKAESPHDTPRERPVDWCLTLDDLLEEMKAGKRKSIGKPESDWAREYEISLLSDEIRFPKKGDLFESKNDQEIQFMTAWSAPFTGGGTATLFKGERVWIHTDSAYEKPLGTYALPVDYKKLEERMVPPEERKDRRFGGFYFYFKTVDLNEKFELIATGYEGKVNDVINGE